MVGNIVVGGMLAVSVSFSPQSLPVPLQTVASANRTESTASYRVSVEAVNRPLMEVLNGIARQAGLRLVWNEDDVDTGSRVTLRAQSIPVKEAFDQALSGRGVQAEFVGNSVVISKTSSVASRAQGEVTGRVVDAKTKQGVSGATVTVNDREVKAGQDGVFRIGDVPPGTYRVQVRMVGYVRSTVTVVVEDGKSSFVEVVMEQNVTALDQVVVTGTVIATSQREVPNAMTVVTAKDIADRGITRIDQLFRGDIPGLFAQNQGSTNPLDEVVMFSRGSTTVPSTDISGQTREKPIKTYVDGIEMADPKYLSQIDPQSIERIEIVTGPQASTIYGSNAISGVMQIFTKRGTSVRPQLSLVALSGWVENDFSRALTPAHQYSASVNGVDGQWSYNAGGGWDYMGPWTPAKQSTRWSGFGGLQIRRGPITADGSMQQAQTIANRRGHYSQVQNRLRDEGWWSPSGTAGLVTPTKFSLRNTTVGATVSYVPISWWRHEVGIGSSVAHREQQSTGPGWSRPADTLLSLNESDTRRTSMRYATAIHGEVGRYLQGNATLGLDAWASRATGVSVRAAELTGSLPSSSVTGTRANDRNTGAFLQGQVGVWDAIFFTAGLRAEWSPQFGEEAQPNWAPKVGVAMTRDVGQLTAKVRLSSGRSTRPPELGSKDGFTLREQWGGTLPDNSTGRFYESMFGNYIVRLPNPSLGPEHQQGVEGGLELYFGQRASLIVTRYDQSVKGLILNAQGVDSVRSHTPNHPDAWRASFVDEEGYAWNYQEMNLNIGNIRNDGWELQGMANVGPLGIRGVYSWTRSRIVSINPEWADRLPRHFVPGSSFKFLPEHTWAAGASYARSGTAIRLNLQGTGMLVSNFRPYFLTYLHGGVRLNQDRLSTKLDGTREAYQWPSRGYVLADLNASHRIRPNVEGLLDVKNVGDYYRNDYWGSDASMGRQTKIGVRVRW